jgi:hypothetical protein
MTGAPPSAGSTPSWLLILRQGRASPGTLLRPLGWLVTGVAWLGLAMLILNGFALASALFHGARLTWRLGSDAASDFVFASTVVLAAMPLGVALRRGCVVGSVTAFLWGLAYWFTVSRLVASIYELPDRGERFIPAILGTLVILLIGYGVFAMRRGRA